MWSNFDTHSDYCDGKGELQEYLSNAKALNMISLGFSSHAPLPFPCKWCMKADAFEGYLSSIDTLNASSPDVEIYKSLEIDFIPGVISPGDFRDRLDYTIGSIHFVEKLPDGTRWEIDGLHSFFLEGYEKIFRSNIKDTIARYYELTREMITTSCPTVIGHLDKIKIQNIDGQLFNEEERWYRQEIGRTLDTIASSNAIVEVNTRGLYKKKSSTTYPSPWILRLIREKNIPVTISADAHHPEDLIRQFPETAAMLATLGFETLAILHEGSWKHYPFNEHGVTLR
jgi:histidinol-phosphatase (PHP family)